MEIYQTMVFFEEERTGRSFLVGTIKFAGELWLIGATKLATAEEPEVPTRLVHLESLDYQRTPGDPDHHFLLNNPMSRAALTGQGQQPASTVYTVLAGPAVSQILTRADSAAPSIQ